MILGKIENMVADMIGGSVAERLVSNTTQEGVGVCTDLSPLETVAAGSSAAAEDPGNTS